MFFTKIGKVIAHLVFWLGLLRLFSAFFIASIDDVSARIAATKTYLGADSLGKEIDQISISLLIAIVEAFYAKSVLKSLDRFSNENCH